MQDMPFDITMHEIRYKFTFNRQWDEYWANCPQLIKPTDGEKLSLLQRCVLVPQEEIGFDTWNGRLAFKNHELREQLLFAVLEGVTTWQPNGYLTFLGMTHWRVGRVRHSADRPPKFAAPDDGWSYEAKQRYVGRRVAECRAWMEVNGPKHPAYREVRRVMDDYLHLSDRLVDTVALPAKSVMSELEELRAEVRRLKTGS